MRKIIAISAALLAGCASEGRIEKRPPSMESISGKTVEAYMECLIPELEDSRRKVEVSGDADHKKIVVPQFVSPMTAAVIFVDRTSRGIEISVHERSANNPIRPKDILAAAKHCI
ncbi:hypothetical protein EAW52_10955 [Pseudomonas sp. LTJR-52]|uniref:hypothetical protein n=1 Tax=Pseudomonas sp. LTJR-52 TaxID=2479392 RepID=UPI000EFC3D0F|nr:hypothetical protein [Pseudomonas sp. LTJR-52]AYN94441.1 hypothetical protein EAW52_10955 [Pseudomonas sp. LTJR-52]